MPVEWVSIDLLKPDPENPNDHPEDQIQDLMKIIRYQGWRHPIIVSKQTGFIRAGHGRFIAAKKMGLREVPVDYQDFLDSDQEYAFQVSDNAIAARSVLNLPLINTQVGTLGPDFDIQLLGMKDFKVEFFDKIHDKPDECKEDQDNNHDDPNDEIPAKIESITKPDDKFKIGPHVLHNGDCLDILKTLPDNSVDSLITDPPAGIAFMGKEWDEDKGGSKEWIAWLSGVMKESLRVVKPGGHGLVWALPRTSHWTATALENAGFEIRDVVTHIFGSGFPKSLDISKAIDKAAGAERKVIGHQDYSAPDIRGNSYDQSHVSERDRLGVPITAPSTAEAKQWAGYGTGLKPASEHWILIRKPCSEDTVAQNVLKWGCGGLNIDASRITPGELIPGGGNGKAHKAGQYGGETNGNRPLVEAHTKGRFPANLVLSHNPDCVEVGVKKVKPQTGVRKKNNSQGAGDGIFAGGLHDSSTDYVNQDGTETMPAWECTEGCAVAELDRQSGHLHAPHGSNGGGKTFGSQLNQKAVPCRTKSFIDSGGASRFFYCAKPSKREKNEGCEELEDKTYASRGEEYLGEGGMNRTSQRKNHHPTVKSIKLMQYLITMITPPEGVILDCFGGSGTTLVAAHLKGFQSILIEKQTEYCDIILARAEFVTGKRAERIR